MKMRFGGLSQLVVYFKNCWYRIHDMLCSCPVSAPLAFLFGVFSHITSLTPLPPSEAKPSRHWRTDTHPESAQSGLLGLDLGGSAVRKQTSAGSFHLAGGSRLPSLLWALPSISGAACCVWVHTGGSGGALWDSPRVTRHCSWWCAPTPDSLVGRDLVRELARELWSLGSYLLLYVISVANPCHKPCCFPWSLGTTCAVRIGPGRGF